MNKLFADVANKYADQLTHPWLLVDTTQQRLYLVQSGIAQQTYSVSTSKFGLGAQQDSYKTPQGAHVIAQKIGSNCQVNEVLRAREPSGECAEIVVQAVSSELDLVLTRILWLRGLEDGKNLGPGVDSFNRYIYIHGTNEEGLIGQPASHGCVRMRNNDVIELYACVEENTFVYIN